jgi:glycosyltransferase involved in cell wall biosynthesis
MALREALAVNIPVIATSTGGMTELGPAVVLVPPDDPGALRRALDAFFAAAPLN